MSMDNIAGRIAARMLFTGRRDRAEVAREIAKEDRRAGLHHRLRAASHPTTRQHDDPRQTLYEAIAAMASRLVGASSSSRQAPEPSPRPPVRRRLRERIADAIAPTPERPEPTPPTSPPTSPTVRIPGSSAVLISDLPHNAGGDYVTDNWRKSIADNDRLFDERRGKPKTSIYNVTLC
jgi:hypothetical protein